MESEIWMRRVDNKEYLYYERITFHVDDLLMSHKSPQTIVGALVKECEFKLKGTGPASYHLGCDFTRCGSDNLC